MKIALGAVVALLLATAAASGASTTSVAQNSPKLWALDTDWGNLVGGTRLIGWIATSNPATVSVRTGDRTVVSQAADRPRPDVAAALGVRPRVGFDIDLSGLGFGTHHLCVTATTDKRSIHMGCGLAPVVPARSGPPSGALVVNGAGDTYTNPEWFRGDDGRVDFSSVLNGLDGLFLRDDISVINMDCTPSRLGDPVYKRYNLRCPPRSLRPLARKGVDVISQANNHAIDFGVPAMLDGAENIREAGMFPVGSGRTAAEALTPQLIERDGWRVAVFGFAQYVEFEYWFATENGPGVANGHDIGPVVAAIERWDDLVDVVVVAIHWGRERTFQLTSLQTYGAERMVRAGADVIFGHHPHRVQALRNEDGVPVFYSLGNFVWFHLGGAASDSAVGKVVFRPSGRVRACLLDAKIDRPGSVILGSSRSCITTKRR